MRNHKIINVIFTKINLPYSSSTLKYVNLSINTKFKELKLVFFYIYELLSYKSFISNYSFLTYPYKIILFNYYRNDGNSYTPAYQRVVTALLDHSNMSLEDTEENFPEYDGELFT